MKFLISSSSFFFHGVTNKSLPRFLTVARTFEKRVPVLFLIIPLPRFLISFFVVPSIVFPFVLSKHIFKHRLAIFVHIDDCFQKS